MSNLTTIHDLESGEVITREMTDKEIAEKRKLDAAIQAEKDAAKAKRQAILDKLGITEEEALQLLG
jgi:hypothetical protein